MKEIKIKVVDWWGSQKDINNCFILSFLRRLNYELVWSDDPDYIIYSVFGKKHLNYDHCVKIFYTGENVRANFNQTDYSIGFDFINFLDRHLYLPIFIIKMIEKAKIYKQQIFLRSAHQRKKFCGFLVSSSSGYSPREEFFEKLSSYKRVDSGGMIKNNINYRVSDKYEWLLDYKFNLCFENSSYPGYLTEKLFDAFNAGCIPIYWGDTSLNDKNRQFHINPKSYINAHDFNSLDELVDEVKRIDNCDASYEKILNEPIFLDDFDIVEFYTQKLESFLDNIFSQDKQDAYRRYRASKKTGGGGFWIFKK